MEDFDAGMANNRNYSNFLWNFISLKFKNKINAMIGSIDENCVPVLLSF